MANAGLPPDWVCLLVGGAPFITARATLANAPGYLEALVSSRFGLPTSDAEGRILIDRDPTVFPLVLDFLRNLDAFIPPEDPRLLSLLEREAGFYGLEPLVASLAAAREAGERSRAAGTPDCLLRLAGLPDTVGEQELLASLGGLDAARAGALGAPIGIRLLKSRETGRCDGRAILAFIVPAHAARCKAALDGGDELVLGGRGHRVDAAWPSSAGVTEFETQECSIMNAELSRMPGVGAPAHLQFGGAGGNAAAVAAAAQFAHLMQQAQAQAQVQAAAGGAGGNAAAVAAAAQLAQMMQQQAVHQAHQAHAVVGAAAGAEAAAGGEGGGGGGGGGGAAALQQAQLLMLTAQNNAARQQLVNHLAQLSAEQRSMELTRDAPGVPPQVREAAMARLAHFGAVVAQLRTRLAQTETRAAELSAAIAAAGAGAQAGAAAGPVAQLPEGAQAGPAEGAQAGPAGAAEGGA